MTDSAKLERREVLYVGDVQGVGFRYRCRQIASHFKVVGYVQNLPDGRVRLVVEGRPAELARFLTDVAAAFEVHIRQAQIVPYPASNEFTEFVIRH